MATQSEVAAHLDMSPQNLRDLIGRGVIPGATGKGNLDTDKCRVGYIRYLREVAAGRKSEAETFDLVAERARLAKEQADAQEMKNAQLRGELLVRGEVTAAVQGAFARVRAKLLSLPSKVAPLLIGMDSIADVTEHLRVGVYEALGELSETQVISAGTSGGPDDDGGVPGVVGDAEAAAAPDRERMGRPRKAS